MKGSEGWLIYRYYDGQVKGCASKLFPRRSDADKVCLKMNSKASDQVYYKVWPEGHNPY